MGVNNWGKLPTAKEDDCSNQIEKMEQLRNKEKSNPWLQRPPSDEDIEVWKKNAKDMDIVFITPSTYHRYRKLGFSAIN